MIESVNNEKIKEIAKLKDKKYQIETGKFIVEGAHLVEEASKCGILESVFVVPGMELFYEGATIVSEQVMKKLSSLTTTPKVLGVAKMLTSREIKGDVIMLDRIQDPGNMGTIIRSALAFGIDTIIVGNGSVSIYNPKVVRASEGSMFHINIVERNLIDAINELKSIGYHVYATDVEKGKILHETSFTEKNAIIIGNEGSGVSEELKSLADNLLYIDINKEMESLNVGIATSIILYELKNSKNI